MKKSTHISPSKNRLYNYLILLCSILLLVLAELLLRLFGYGPDLRLFETFPSNPNYYQINPNVGMRYFPTTNVKPQVSKDVFLRKKPPNAFRIFVLGGSSAAGYPYLYNGSFSSILKIILKEYYPDKTIEVVNLAMPAVSSYAVRDLGLELKRYKPDLYLIYAGHNEFYGALGVGATESLGTSRTLTKLFISLRQFKIFELISDGIVLLQKGIGKLFGKSPKQHGTLMERMVEKNTIPYKSELFWDAQRNFQKNISDVIQFCRKRNIPVLIGTVVSNVHHQKPFVDYFSKEQSRKEWLDTFQQAEDYFEHGGYQNALESATQTIKIDSMPASQYFLRGKIYEESGDSANAYQFYYRAKEFDALRFRASEVLNEMIEDFGKQGDVQVVPVKTAFEQKSPMRLPGKELLLEHLHPNIEGYCLIAKKFAEAIISSEYLGEPVSTTIPDSIWKNKIGVTDVDRRVADLRIKALMMGWPFTDREPAAKNELQPGSSDFIEQLAFRFWKDEITWEKMHVEAAQYYTKINNFEKAEREYLALIQATPMNASPYEFLARLLIYRKKFNEALSYLLKILELENNGFAYKMIGSIYVNKKEASRGIPYLEKAIKMDPTDPQSLYNLAGAYALNQDFEQALQVIQQLKKIRPDYPGLKQLQEQIDKVKIEMN